MSQLKMIKIIRGRVKLILTCLGADAKGTRFKNSVRLKISKSFYEINISQWYGLGNKPKIGILLNLGYIIKAQSYE